jgi:alpha-tubulin suppressor-like RCC1 family protein
VFPCALTPVAVSGGFTFTQITGGGSHTCGLTADGTAYCWGSGASGQLGDNSTSRQQTPVPVATGLRFTTIDAGANHTCGLTGDGTAYCWGSNTRGQLGDGTVTSRSTPAAVSGGIAFDMIVAGGFDIGHTCGLAADGTAYCWGDNELGQLGIGSADVAVHPEPVPVSGGLSFTALTAGLDRHTCGLVSSGAAYCWGENAFGALGDGSATTRTTPVRVTGNLVFAQLKAGGYIGHTCGITNAGIAYCWGENERGAVGDGSTTDRFSPTAVSGGLRFAALDAGFRHTCGLTDTSVLYCWGSGSAGQLGLNSTSQSNAPAKVVGQP